jgi:hypothetical protein
MADAQDDTMVGENVKVEMTNPKLKTMLSEYGRRERTDGMVNNEISIMARMLMNVE